MLLTESWLCDSRIDHKCLNFLAIEKGGEPMHLLLLGLYHRYAREITDLVFCPHVIASSAIEIKLGVFRFMPSCQPHKNKLQQMQNECFFYLSTLFGIFIFKLRPQLMQVTYTPDEQQLF